MNTKTSKMIITIIALAIPSISYSQIDKASAMQAINEFKAEESSEKLQQCVNRIEREPSLSDSSRAELLVQVLAASVQYLEKHPKPAETPQINVAPPDDSIEELIQQASRIRLCGHNMKKTLRLIKLLPRRIESMEQ
jgi:hypothetical protein